MVTSADIQNPQTSGEPISLNTENSAPVEQPKILFIESISRILRSHPIRLFLGTTIFVFISLSALAAVQYVQHSSEKKNQGIVENSPTPNALIFPSASPVLVLMEPTTEPTSSPNPTIKPSIKATAKPTPTPAPSPSPTPTPTPTLTPQPTTGIIKGRLYKSDGSVAANAEPKYIATVRR